MWKLTLLHTRAADLWLHIEESSPAVPSPTLSSQLEPTVEPEDSPYDWPPRFSPRSDQHSYSHPLRIPPEPLYPPWSGGKSSCCNASFLS